MMLFNCPVFFGSCFVLDFISTILHAEMLQLFTSFVGMQCIQRDLASLMHALQTCESGEAPLLLQLTLVFSSFSGIVYCFSRKDSVTIASSLMSRGIKAACYHGDLDGQSRSEVHRAWTRNAIQVIWSFFLINSK